MPTVFSKLIPLEAGGALASSPDADTDGDAGAGARVGARAGAASTSAAALAGAGGGGFGGRSHAAVAMTNAQLPHRSHRVCGRTRSMSFGLKPRETTPRP